MKSKKNISCRRLPYLLRRFILPALIIAALPIPGRSAAGSEIILPPAEEVVTDSLTDEVTELDDLVVTATPALVQSDGAKLTYNVSEDPDSKTQSTLDILRKVPGVTVDAQENVKVNGQSSFKIFLNGKEDPMLSGDVKTILKSTPASTIQKIEVISEPGAKYEAEGAGGILNIVTTSRQALEGYLANIGLSFHNQGGSVYGYGRTKINKVTASANLNYYNGFIRSGNADTSRSETLNYEDESEYRRVSESYSTTTGHYFGGGVDLSWEPDTLNLFTISLNGRDSRWPSESDETMYMYDVAGNPVWSIVRSYETGYLGSGIATQASYQRTFGRREHTLVGSYSFNHGASDNDSYIHTDELTGFPVTDQIWSSNVRHSRDNFHIFQIDYTNSFTPKHLLEAGAKGSWRRSASDAAPWYGPSREELAIDDSQRVSMRQLDDITALYASYTGKYTHWNVRAGLRYEHTRRGIRYLIAPEGYHDFTNSFNDWVPDASVSFSWGDSQNLRAAYQMRISRPGLYVLNPYRNTLTPGYVSYGNPDLKSEKSHNISLSYQNYDHPLNGSFKTTYYFSRNSITDIIFSSADLPGVIQTTYANVGRYNNLSFQLNLNWRISNSFSCGLYLQEAYMNLKAESQLLNARRVCWNTGINANADYTLPCRLRISLYGGYGSPWADLQTKASSWYYYSIGLGRSFLKEERLTLNLTLNTLFPTHRTYTWTQSSETAWTSTTTCSRQWNLGFNISWRLGGLNADVKKTASRLEAPETDSGSNSIKK
ncbi:MAG: TonB-dependent receptor [Muribaculaceae bacterium]|nr:TonB-dependent receptor [Muribaculaceae bacterium]